MFKKLKNLGPAKNKSELNKKLLKGATLGDYEMCQKAILKGANIDIKDFRGCSALHWAAWTGNEKTMQVFE
jgi:ankyrin repeat protein